MLNQSIQPHNFTFSSASHKLFITEKPSLGRNLVQKLSKLYTAEKFEDYGNCFESDSFIVTWAMGHLFRISAASLSRQEMEDRIECMGRDHKICPDWDFEFQDASRQKHFEALKSLINGSEVESIVHAGSPSSDSEVMIRVILHRAAAQKPMLRLVLKTGTYSEIAAAMNGELSPISCFDSLAEEGFRNMLENYWRGNTHFCQGDNPANQVPTCVEEAVAKELRVLTSGNFCSKCRQREACKDTDSVTVCAGFTPDEDFFSRLKNLCQL